MARRPIPLSSRIVVMALGQSARRHCDSPACRYCVCKATSMWSIRKDRYKSPCPMPTRPWTTVPASSGPGAQPSKTGSRSTTTTLSSSMTKVRRWMSHSLGCAMTTTGAWMPASSTCCGFATRWLMNCGPTSIPNHTILHPSPMPETTLVANMSRCSSMAITWASLTWRSSWTASR